jgi:hypothetical protein
MTGEGTFSRQLPTGPLPAPPVPIDYCGRNRRFSIYGGFIVNSCESDFMSHSEEQLDLPASAIDLGDRECRQMKSVRQEHERETAFRIEVSDTPKDLGMVLAAFPEIEANRLIAPHSAGLVDLPGLDDIEAQVALAADHEESLRGMKPMQSLEVHVAAAMPDGGICRIAALVCSDSDLRNAA